MRCAGRHTSRERDFARVARARALRKPSLEGADGDADLLGAGSTSTPSRREEARVEEDGHLLDAVVRDIWKEPRRTFGEENVLCSAQMSTSTLVLAPARLDPEMSYRESLVLRLS